jgi:hypothetical protein
LIYIEEWMEKTQMVFESIYFDIKRSKINFYKVFYHFLQFIIKFIVFFYRKTQFCTFFLINNLHLSVILRENMSEIKKTFETFKHLKISNNELIPKLILLLLIVIVPKVTLHFVCLLY